MLRIIVTPVNNEEASHSKFHSHKKMNSVNNMNNSEADSSPFKALDENVAQPIPQL